MAGLARNVSNEDEALGTWRAVFDPRIFLGNGKEGARPVSAEVVSFHRAEQMTRLRKLLLR